MKPVLDLTARYEFEGIPGTYQLCETCKRLSAIEDMTRDTKTRRGVCTPCFLEADRKVKQREAKRLAA